MRPELAELWHLFLVGEIVRDGNAGELHDAALDRVHEREVAHGPREEGALGVSGASEKERRGGKVEDPVYTDSSAHGFEARDPEAGCLAVALDFVLLFSGDVVFFCFLVWLLAVAMVGLVVEDHDPLDAHETGHYTLEHLPFSLQCLELRPSSLEQRSAAAGKLHGLPELEGVVVGDDDLRPIQIGEHVVGHKLAALVIAVGVIRLEHAEARADGQAGSHHQKATTELLAPGSTDRVDRLPCDEHGHDGCLSRTGCELQGKSREPGIRRLVGGVEVVEKQSPILSGLWCNLSQPDRRLHGFHLAEEGAHAAVFVLPPVL